MSVKLGDRFLKQRLGELTCPDSSIDVVYSTVRSINPNFPHNSSCNPLAELFIMVFSCSQATVKTLWMKIRHDEPELMSNFEDFLYKVSNDIQRARGDFDSLEAALKR